MQDFYDSNQFLKTLNNQGFVVVKNVVDKSFTKQMSEEMMTAIEQEVAYHNTTDYDNYTRLLIAPLYGGTFLDILDHKRFIAPMEQALEEKCILYTMTSSCLPPGNTNFTSRLHNDSSRIISGYRTALVGMLLLDDFTTTNGATYFLPGSNQSLQQPDAAYFEQHAIPVVAPAGSVCYFDPAIWHRSTLNKSNNWRRCLLVYMIRPWMKQRFDLPRAMKNMDLSDISETVKQKLGFFNQPPVSYDDFYQQSEMRHEKIASVTENKNKKD